MTRKARALVVDDSRALRRVVRLELEALGLLVRAPDCQRLRRDGSNETEGLPADVEAGWAAEDTPEVRVEKALAAVARAF